MHASPQPSEIRDWSAAAVKLLQGVVYSDDAKTWNALLQNVSSLESFFGRLGLLLIVDEPDGCRYRRQLLVLTSSYDNYYSIPSRFCHVYK